MIGAMWIGQRVDNATSVIARRAQLEVEAISEIASVASLPRNPIYEFFS